MGINTDIDDEDEVFAEHVIPTKPKVEKKPIAIGKVFVPGKRDMKVEYPELSEIEAFSTMNDKDIRLCWYYACKSSEFNSIDDNNLRMQLSLEKAYGKNWFSNPTAKKLSMWDIPDYIKIGMEAMANFSPQHRSEANALMAMMFRNLQAVVDVDTETFEMWTPSERKAYVQLVSETATTLPNIVSQLERGFAVRINEATGDQKETQAQHSGLMDRLMDESEN